MRLQLEIPDDTVADHILVGRVLSTDSKYTLVEIAHDDFLEVNDDDQFLTLIAVDLKSVLRVIAYVRDTKGFNPPPIEDVQI
jgi:hypothetical protein